MRSPKALLLSFSLLGLLFSPFSDQSILAQGSPPPSIAPWLPLLLVDKCIDLDDDGYGDPASDGCLYIALDCDDTDADVNPGEKEGPPPDPICTDLVDNDCDGDTDSSDLGCNEYYTRTLVSQTFIGGGTARGWNDDDACWSYTLPFTFPFFGTSYGSVYVCSNGFLDFTSSNPDASNSLSEFKSRVMIAPVWDDLLTNQLDDDIYIHQPTSNSVAIRWDGRTFVGTNLVNVECVLYETGRIQFNYGEGNTGLTPTIGISMGDDTNYYLSPHDGQGTLTEVNSDRYTIP